MLLKIMSDFTVISVQKRNPSEKLNFNVKVGLRHSMQVVVSFSMAIYSTDSQKFNYSMFGLAAASDIMIPQLLEVAGEPDIYIVRGKTPRRLRGPLYRSRNIQISKTGMLLKVKGVGRYYIDSGKYIVVEPLKGSDMQTVRLFLLGSAMGALLFQRGILPLHGSAVVMKDKAVIITGASGAGKSSLAMAFREKGYSFVTDDIAAIKHGEDGSVYVLPSYPQQKLWQDSIEYIGGEVENLEQINRWNNKFYYPVGNDFCNSPARLTAVCEIVPRDKREVEIYKVDGVEKIDVLMRNIYRYQWAGFFGNGKVYFTKCADIAKHVDVFRMFRPENGFSVDEQVKKLQECLS